MAEMNAGMNAGQFFWSKIDKNGSGKIDDIFETAEAEKRGFKVRNDMTEEQFIAENKAAIQQRALFDVEYAQYQFEQAGHPLKKADSSSSQTVEQLIEQAKSTVSKLGPRPSLGVDPKTGGPMVVVQPEMSQEEIEQEKDGADVDNNNSVETPEEELVGDSHELTQEEIEQEKEGEPSTSTNNQKKPEQDEPDMPIIY